MLRCVLLARNVVPFTGSISIGTGVESFDEYIRNICLNKKLPIEVMLRAVNVLQDCQIKFYHYHLLGKPFLTSDEDIDDTVISIRKSFEIRARNGCSQIN